MRVAINGFGRIGRNIFKIALEKGVNVTAINDLQSPEQLAYLLKYDSVYGKYIGVKFDKENLIVNEKRVRVYNEKDPERLPWKEQKVDIVIESTGLFTTSGDAEKHLKAGAKKVIISAPGKGNVRTIVPGVNDKDLKKTDSIISVASCTTNCVSPVLKVLEKAFGIRDALMTTVHAYTSSQPTVDSPSKNMRRGRAAALNIVPTTTGASKAVIEVLPKMKGKIQGMAMRVPVPAGSVVDLVARLKKNFDVEKIKDSLKKASKKEMKGILEYTEDEIVSQDIVGNSHSSIIDGLSMYKQGDMIKIIAWYDNEFGYSNRVVDVTKSLKRFL